MPPFILLLRPQQWVKNAFVAAPLFFTPLAVTAANLAAVGWALVCFCALSSAVYIINDYMDREADRLHPSKRLRPLAAGTVPVALAGLLLALLLGVALVTALWLPNGFRAAAAAYFLVNLSYSLKLKQVSIVDVMLVAIGFVLRVYAGAAVIGVEPSVWIVICTGLLALFLALAKRRDDLVKRVDAEHRGALKGYNKAFIDMSLTAVVGGLLVSYLIYTTDPSRHRLYLTAPFVIAGVLRYLQVTLVEERSGSPTTIALTDRFMLLAVLGWVVTCAVLIYG